MTPTSNQRGKCQGESCGKPLGPHDCFYCQDCANERVANKHRIPQKGKTSNGNPYEVHASHPNHVKKGGGQS